MTGSGRDARRALTNEDDDKIRLLTELASRLAAGDAGEDDGVVHFYEEYEGDGKGGVDDTRCRAVFPTGFQHAPDGPVVSAAVAANGKGVDAKCVAQIQAETVAERKRMREMLMRLQDLDETEAGNRESDAASPETGAGVDSGAGVDAGAVVDAGAPRVRQEAPSKSSSSSSTDMSMPSIDNPSPSICSAELPSNVLKKPGVDAGTEVETRVRAGPFGSGFARSFLNASAKPQKKRADYARKALSANAEASKDESSLEYDLLPATPSAGGASKEKSRPMKRVSFAEPIDDFQDTGSTTHERTKRAAAPVFQYNGTMLELVEGATADLDDALTAERVSHLDEILAMEALGDDAISSSSEDDDENEYGFISEVLGPSDFAERMRAKSELSTVSAVAPAAASPPPVACIPASRTASTTKCTPSSKRASSSKSIPSSKNAPSQPEPGAVSSCDDEQAAAKQAGAPLSDSVLERPANRRRAARRPRGPTGKLTPQPAIWNVISAEADEAAAEEDERRRSPIEPIPPNEEELPIEPIPVVSKFKKLREREAQA
jgi:hypothetical protein